VTKTELLLVQLDNVKDCSSSSLVVLSLCYQLCSKDVVASFEFRVQHFVGEASPTDGNSSQDTITLVLVHHQTRFNSTRLFVGVGDNTTNEMGLSLVESDHKVIKLALEIGGDSLATTLLLATSIILGSFKGLSWMISEALNHERIASVLDHLNNGIVEGILVFVQPASQVVGDSGSIVDDCEMRIGVRSGVGLGKL